MGRRKRTAEIDESALEVGGKAHAAAGLTAVGVAMKRAVEEMGVARTAKTLTKLNQVDGFDCQGCAWPDPDPEHRHTAEFCENGAKAVAEEATRDRVGPEFFARHSIDDLRQRTDYWLGHRGRITQPMVLRAGGTHYEPIEWDAAFGMIADRLRDLASPDEAVFYTSGKTSNEAAFVYQLFVRAFGTNNLPDCSNMCHESSGVALAEVIGIGKGSVSLEDIHRAELIVVMGQNPGTNHPRMLSALEVAKRNGARILAINPLEEAGLVRFKNPQKPRGLIGKGTGLADLHLPVRVNGDLALFQAIGSLLVEWDAIDHDFVERHGHGFEEWAAHVKALDWDAVRRSTGLERDLIVRAAEMFRDSSATVTCWAMGITQHRNAVATIKEIANVALAQGNIGKPGAGLCPVRGHSNVQGDRTMGIWERVPPHFLDALRDEFGFDPPREDGFDTVEAVRALRDGRAQVFMGMGGNFVSAVSDTEVTERAMRNAGLTVHVSTKLNRSHVVTGTEALILPVLGRSEKDTDRRPRAAGHRRGLDVRRTRLSRTAEAGLAAPAVRGRHHLQPRSRDTRRRAPGAVGDDARRLHRDQAADRQSRTRLRGVRREGRPARRLRAPAPAPRHPHLPDRGGQGGVHGQPDRRARGARGPAAAADAALARPVQHDHLRPRRPLPRGVRRPAGRLRAPRRHRAPRVRRR